MPAAIIALIFNSVATSSWANDIYIQQSGNYFTSTITQDGEGNSIRSLNTNNGSASVGGNNKTFTVTQTGDNNRTGFWTHGGNQVISVTQDGNLNVSAVDNHGNNNNITVNIQGDSNVTHTEIGNGGDENNDMKLTDLDQRG